MCTYWHNVWCWGHRVSFIQVAEFKKDTGIDLSKDRLAIQRLREVQ